MSTTAARLPEHPPHEPHVPCVEVVKALAPAAPPPAPPAPPETKTPTAVDLPVPARRLGPLRKGCMIALRQNRQLDAAGQQRADQALADARAIVAEETRAKAARQADLLQAVVEDHGPIEIPEGYGLRDVVEQDGTYLELVEVAKRPAQPARRGS